MITVLLVDDIEAIRKTTESLLIKQGDFEVISVSDKKTAIKIFLEKRSEIDLVVTDLRLVDDDGTNVDGFEIANYIRKFDSNIVLIGVSAYTQTDKYKNIFDMYFEKSPSKPSESFFNSIPKIIDLVKSRK